MGVMTEFALWGVKAVRPKQRILRDLSEEETDKALKEHWRKKCEALSDD